METIQGRKLFAEIRYSGIFLFLIALHLHTVFIPFSDWPEGYSTLKLTLRIWDLFYIKVSQLSFGHKKNAPSKRISPHCVQPLQLRIQYNGLKSFHISIFYKSCLCIQCFFNFITICWIWIMFNKVLAKTEIFLQKEFRPWFWLAIIAWPGPEVPPVKETFMLFQD